MTDYSSCRPVDLLPKKMSVTRGGMATGRNAFLDAPMSNAKGLEQTAAG